MIRNTSQMNETNLFEDTNWHENIENNFIKIASYKAGREKILGAIIYQTNAY